MQDELLHPDRALCLALEAAPPPSLETIPLEDALGRALPFPLASSLDQPPFDKSSMDGFAYDSARPAELYKVRALVAAGSLPERPIGQGECARIMTGAPLPPGANAVQRVERSEPAGRDEEGLELVRFTAAEPSSNVIRRGENLRAGEELLGPRILAPQDIGILASSGYSAVSVARRPVVGVISTGDELRAAGAPLSDAEIYDSNGPQLVAQARAAGCDARFLGIVRDEEEQLEAALRRALEDCDVVLVSGGVSMGDFDYVPRSLEALGVERVFHKIAMRPGKPCWFGRRGDKAVFGLPGNPLSTFVNFEFLVRPYLLKRMGLDYEPRLLRVALASALSRREAERVDFLPCRLERGEAGRGAALARPLAYTGSSMLSVLAEADCLVRMERGVLRLEEGEAVDARLLRP